MILRNALPLIGALLAGCVSLPQPHGISRDTVQDFAIEGRFALRAVVAGEAPRNGAGRLDWTHRQDSDRILLANPLGHTLAEIEVKPGRSQMRTSNGGLIESNDPDSLIEAVTGQRLPVTRMPRWLLGRGGPEAEIERDAHRRPVRLTESGWQITYVYDDTDPAALPSRLTLMRSDEIELKIRIETWKTQP